MIPGYSFQFKTLSANFSITAYTLFACFSVNGLLLAKSNVSPYLKTTVPFGKLISSPLKLILPVVTTSNKRRNKRYYFISIFS